MNTRIRIFCFCVDFGKMCCVPTQLLHDAMQSSGSGSGSGSGNMIQTLERFVSIVFSFPYIH